PYSYNQIDGLEIRPVMRWLYRDVNPEPRHFPNAKTAREYLIDLCNTPMNYSDQERGVTRLMHFIYLLRPDLQQAFALSHNEGPRQLTEWFRSSAVVEYHLTQEIEGVTTSSNSLPTY